MSVPFRRCASWISPAKARTAENIGLNWPQIVEEVWRSFERNHKPRVARLAVVTRVVRHDSLSTSASRVSAGFDHPFRLRPVTRFCEIRSTAVASGLRTRVVTVAPNRGLRRISPTKEIRFPVPRRTPAVRHDGWRRCHAGRVRTRSPTPLPSNRSRR